MGWFAGRTPEDKVADAAFGAAWDVLDPVAGRIRLDQDSLNDAWGRAWPAAVKANNKKLPEDLARLQAQKGFGAAVQRWDGRVADLIATKRGVISEAAATVAGSSFADLGTPEEVRAATDRAYDDALRQARWHNDGVYALSEEDFALAVRAGVVRAADERTRQLRAPSMGAPGTGSRAGSEPIALNDATGRAREMARDAARFAAVAALSARSETEIAESGESLALDAAAAAIQALPREICDRLDEDEQAAAVVEGAGEALREAGHRAGAPGAAAATGAAAAGEPATVPPAGSKSPGYEGPTPGFFGKAGAAGGAAAGKAAGGARVTRQRLSVAARVKTAVDAKLPTASGYGLSGPESDRAYAAARSAALEQNERIGSPFTPEEALRIANMTTTTIVTTWYAIGHLQRSGASEAVGGMAKDAVRRLLGSTPLPPTLIDYLVEEAVRVATPEWGRVPPAGAGSDRWADRAASARARSARYTYRGRQVPNYYELLQVSPKAGHDVIEKAWRVLIAQSHPDNGGDPVRAAQLNEAREILLNADARRAYDQENGF
jgi:hypothetical protein